jgi:DNA-binding NarL/FixJ family response regulator
MQTTTRTGVVAVGTAPELAVRSLKKGKDIGVLLVDDHKIVRQGLVSLLRFESHMQVVGEAANGQEAVELARKFDPDVVVMDINMPVMDGVEATRIITRELPHVKVIGLSMYMEHDVAEAMQKAGAAGYLTKGGRSEDLINAIRACVADRDLVDKPE